MTQNKPQTSKEFFLNLTILHASLIIGQVLFIVIFFYMNSSGTEGSGGEDLDQVFQLIIPIAVIGGLFGSMVLPNRRLQAIKGETDIKEKLANYRGAMILKYALLEGPALIAIVGYYITDTIYYLGFALILIVAQLIYRPTRDRTANDLELSLTEVALIEDPDSIVT